MRMRALAALLAALTAATTALSGCSVYDIPLPGGADTGKNPMTVHVMFRDVLDLVPQSTVKVDDVTVGKVTGITLKGYTADVAIQLPRSIDLPDNVRAEIRQTSLLGEKFVSLAKPESPSGRLSDGDVIGLDRSGRNPEVEEVLGALALLLNGGGVAQLKTIAEEVNAALGGREDAVRSIIDQVGSFMGQLDANKDSIVTALENVNRLSLELRRQDGAIKAALDELPVAVASLDSQRSDLVTMLQALRRLSAVGVRVIQASKESTIDSLRNLAPVLEAFAEAGDDLPKSLQALMTYPFIDAAVGSDPQVARNLHMGDYTNLSMRLNLDLLNLPNIPGLAPGVSLADLVDTCKKTPLAAICTTFQDLLSGAQLKQVCRLLPMLCAKKGASTGKPSGGLGGLGLGGLLGGGAPSGSATTPPGGAKGGGSSGGVLSGLLGTLGLGRVATGPGLDGGAPAEQDPFLLDGTGYDPALGTLLMQGVAVD